MKEEIKKHLDSANFKFKDINENGIETELTLSEVIEKLINDNKLLAKENHRYDDALRMANKTIDLLSKRIMNVTKYIENYLHEHVIEDHPDEQSTFYDEQDNFIPNAKEELLNILQGKDEGENK